LGEAESPDFSWQLPDPNNSNNYRLIDFGDVLLLDAAVRLLKSTLLPLTAYNVNPGTFYDNPPGDGNHNGKLEPAEYVAPSPFLTLIDSGAMTNARDTFKSALDKMIAGLDATLNETEDDHDLIAWHTQGSGVTRQDLQEARAGINDLKTNGNLKVESPSGQEETIKVNLDASPVADLRTVLPTMVYDSTKQDYVPESWPDKTYGGLFPEGLPDWVFAWD